MTTFFPQDEYVTNERQIAMDLWNMVLEFYKLYPKYDRLDLYIFGESYGTLLVSFPDFHSNVE